MKLTNATPFCVVVWILVLIIAKVKEIFAELTGILVQYCIFVGFFRFRPPSLGSVDKSWRTRFLAGRSFERSLLACWWVVKGRIDFCIGAGGQMVVHASRVQVDRCGFPSQHRRSRKWHPIHRRVASQRAQRSSDPKRRKDIAIESGRCRV